MPKTVVLKLFPVNPDAEDRMPRSAAVRLNEDDLARIKELSKAVWEVNASDITASFEKTLWLDLDFGDACDLICRHADSELSRSLTTVFQPAIRVGKSHFQLVALGSEHEPIDALLSQCIEIEALSASRNGVIVRGGEYMDLPNLDVF